MLNANDVANFFIEVGSYNDNTEMTNARINKLLYFAQGWHLALKGTPLFSEDFEAWDYGPIINSIYKKYKGYKKGLITKPDDNFSIDSISEDDFEFLSDVFTFYVNDSTYALIKETHKKGSPWERVFQRGMNNIINKEDIKNYFTENNNFKSFKDVINTLPKVFEPNCQLNEFKHNGKTVKLFYPYTIIPEKIGNEYIFVDEKHNIYCCSTNINELVGDIKENIYMLYKMYVECDESELNSKALEFRKAIENFIESVD